MEIKQPCQTKALQDLNGMLYFCSSKSLIEQMQVISKFQLPMTEKQTYWF